MRCRTIAWTSLFLAVVAAPVASAQQPAASWLDDERPASWNEAGMLIPSAPKTDDEVDPKCAETARPPELEEDKRLRFRGWDLVGAYQGGWNVRIVQATAGYDGMCRPRQYQAFVFVRGIFAGTLSPQPMDSRTDGALATVSLLAGDRLTAEYARYAETDPLCCPSGTTIVAFDIDADVPVVRPVSASTVRR